MKNVPPIGRFTRKVQFKNFSKNPVVANSAGKVETELPPYAESWAAVEQVAQNRTFDASADQQITELNIWTRHSNDIQGNLKRDTVIVYEGLDYSINSVDAVEEGSKMYYHFKVVGVK